MASFKKLEELKNEAVSDEFKLVSSQDKFEKIVLYDYFSKNWGYGDRRRETSE